MRAPRVDPSSCPSAMQRAQGMPGAQCTRSLVCAGGIEVCTRVFTAEAPETSGIPHAMVLTAYGVISPRTGCAPRHFLDDRTSLPGWARATPAKLDTRIGVSGPHALTVRNTAARLARLARSLTNCFALRPRAHTTPSRPPHPTPRFVTIARYGMARVTTNF